MLQTLISSKTRIKLLLKFFLNSNTRSWLRGLESEFGESSNAIRLELNKLEEAGLLLSEAEGNKKIYTANTKHPLFGDIHNILLKHVGIDQIVEKVVGQIGNLHAAYLMGDLAQGKESKVIDLLLVGNKLNNQVIMTLIQKAEGYVQRKIRFLVISPNDLNDFISLENSVLIWEGATGS